MKTLITVLLTTLIVNSYGQANIEKFILDLKNKNISNLEVFDKHFLFNQKVSPSIKDEVIMPILVPKFNFLRQKLSEDCSKLIILKHDKSINVINSFNLRYENFDNVYYILCNGTIVTPVLINNSKIISISTYSKTEGGNRAFIIY